MAPAFLEQQDHQCVHLGTTVSAMGSHQRIEVERFKFDPILMQNPEVAGVQYQRGELAGWELRAYLLEKFQYRCAYCHRAERIFELDHIVPRSRGGSDRASNFALSCYDCNSAKGNRTASEFEYPQVEAMAKRHEHILETFTSLQEAREQTQPLPGEKTPLTEEKNLF